MSTDIDEIEIVETLVRRAHQARAQAAANRRDLEMTLSRARSFSFTDDCSPLTPFRPEPRAEDVRIKELQETIEGLLKRLESQAPIEQAKGIIMAQTHCQPDEAFEILRRASQRSNTKLRALAMDLVTRTSKAEPRH